MKKTRVMRKLVVTLLSLLMALQFALPVFAEGDVPADPPDEAGEHEAQAEGGPTLQNDYFVFDAYAGGAGYTDVRVDVTHGTTTDGVSGLQYRLSDVDGSTFQDLPPAGNDENGHPIPGWSYDTTNPDAPAIVVKKEFLASQSFGTFTFVPSFTLNGEPAVLEPALSFDITVVNTDPAHTTTAVLVSVKQTAPAADDTDLANHLAQRVFADLPNGTHSASFAIEKLAEQSLSIKTGQDDDADHASLAGNSGTIEELTVDTSAIAATGGTYTFDLVISESPRIDRVYTFSLTVEAPILTDVFWIYSTKPDRILCRSSHGAGDAHNTVQATVDSGATEVTLYAKLGTSPAQTLALVNNGGGKVKLQEREFLVVNTSGISNGGDITFTAKVSDGNAATDVLYTITVTVLPPRTPSPALGAFTLVSPTPNDENKIIPDSAEPKKVDVAVAKDAPQVVLKTSKSAEQSIGTNGPDGEVVRIDQDDPENVLITVDTSGLAANVHAIFEFNLTVSVDDPHFDYRYDHYYKVTITKGTPVMYTLTAVEPKVRTVNGMTFQEESIGFVQEMMGVDDYNDLYKFDVKEVPAGARVRVDSMYRGICARTGVMAVALDFAEDVTVDVKPNPRIAHKDNANLGGGIVNYGEMCWFTMPSEAEMAAAGVTGLTITPTLTFEIAPITATEELQISALELDSSFDGATAADIEAINAEIMKQANKQLAAMNRGEFAAAEITITDVADTSFTPKTGNAEARWKGRFTFSKNGFDDNMWPHIPYFDQKIRTIRVITNRVNLSLSANALRLLPAQDAKPAPTATLTATVAPTTAETELVWRSTKPSVVAVQPGPDGRTATLTAGLRGSAVVSVSTPNGASSASCAVTVDWAEGSLSLTEGTPPVEKDYLLMAKTDAPVVLNIAAAGSAVHLGTPTDLTAPNTAVETVVSSAGDTLTITPKGVGTAYARVGVPGNPGLVATCKVVVYEADGGAPARRRIDNTTLTVYRRQQAPDLRVPLVLEADGTPWKLTDASYALAGANENATALLKTAFKIEPHPDGQSLRLVKQDGFDLPASQYKATITVALGSAEPSATLIPDTLTIKLNSGLPKLSATAVTIESFSTNRTADIRVAGPEGLSYTLGENKAKESANKKMRDWVMLDNVTDAETVTLKAGTPKKSGTYYLTATLNGWDADKNGKPAAVNLSLKVNSTYTAPQLKLNKATATVYETVSKTEGIPLQLLPKAADATLAGLSIRDLQVVPKADLTAAEAKTYTKQGSYTTANSYDAATGSFSLFSTSSAAYAKYPAGKVLLGARVDGNEDWLVRVPVTVKLVKPNGTVKLAANVTSVTLNQLLSDPAQREFTFVLDTNVPGYEVDWDAGVSHTLKRGKVDAERAGEMTVSPAGNSFTVRLGANFKPGASYKLVVTKKDLYRKGTAEKPGKITLTIKTVKATAKVGAKLSVTGKTDLTSGAYAVLTAKLAGYLGGYTTEPKITVTPPKSVPNDMKDAMREAFTFEPVGSGGTSWRIVPKPGIQVFPGSYTVSLSGGSLPGVATEDLPTPKTVKFTVSAAKPKVTQSATKVTMHPADQYDTASVSFTLPAGTPPVKEVRMKGYEASLYDFTYNAGTVTIRFKHAGQTDFDAKKLRSKNLSFEVYLAGNAKAATSFKVGVTAKAFK